MDARDPQAQGVCSTEDHAAANKGLAIGIGAVCHSFLFARRNICAQIYVRKYMCASKARDLLLFLEISTQKEQSTPNSPLS